MAGNGAVGSASYGNLLMTSLLVLAAVCAVAVVAVRIFGRMFGAGRSRGAQLMDVVARVALEPRRSLYVVAVAGKTLLVGTSEMGLSVLTELDESAVKAHAVPPPSFGALVRAAWSKRGTAASRHAAKSEVQSDQTLNAEFEQAHQTESERAPKAL